MKLSHGGNLRLGGTVVPPLAKSKERKSILMRKYRVNTDYDYLEPEESLLESVSPDSKIEKPIKSGFFILFYFFISIVLLIFLFASARLQLFNHEYFAVLSARNKFISIPISPPPAD